jgi:predicted transcriptional regulator
MQATITRPTTANTTRAQIMIFRYRNGETLREIASSYGITHERVRQIMRDYCRISGTPALTRYAGPRMRRAEQLERVL